MEPSLARAPAAEPRRRSGAAAAACRTSHRMRRCSTAPRGGSSAGDGRPPRSGPARNREDLQRRAHDPGAAARRAAGRRHGPEPQGHHQPPERRVRGGRGRRPDAHRRPPGGAAEGPCADERSRSSSRRAGSPRAEAATRDGGEPPFNLVAGTAWLWATRRTMERAVDVLVHRRSGPVLAGQCAGGRACGAEAGAPRRSPAAQPAAEGDPSARHRGVASSSTWRERTGSSARTRGCSWARPGACGPRSPRSLRSCSTRASSGRGRELAAQRAAPAATGRRSRASTGSPGAARGQRVRESPEEAEAVAELFVAMLSGGATFTDRNGETRPLSLDDVLVVAPYNAQVELIPGRSSGRVRGRTRRHGRQVPGPGGRRSAIYSLASSSAEDAPRGMEFLYALDRLNVATSTGAVRHHRRRESRVLMAECKRPEQMRMVNALVRYAEMAGEGPGRKGRPPSVACAPPATWIAGRPLAQQFFGLGPSPSVVPLPFAGSLAYITTSAPT